MGVRNNGILEWTYILDVIGNEVGFFDLVEIIAGFMGLVWTIKGSFHED